MCDTLRRVCRDSRRGDAAESRCPCRCKRLVMLACFRRSQERWAQLRREQRPSYDFHMANTQSSAGRGAHRVTTYSVMKLTSELPRAHTAAWWLDNAMESASARKQCHDMT